MDADSLRGLLEGRVSGHEFQANIAEEVSTWCKLLRKRGASAPVTLNPPTSPFVITRDGASRLLDVTLSGQLMNESLAYVLDALLLSHDVEWAEEQVQNRLEGLSGSDDAGGISTAEISSARADLQNIETRTMPSSSRHPESRRICAIS